MPLLASVSPTMSRVRALGELDFASHTTKSPSFWCCSSVMPWTFLLGLSAGKVLV